MFQGSPEEVSRNRVPFAFDPGKLDALLLTHAHLDHCGRIPALVKAGYRGPVHATQATLDIAEIVWLDAAKLQQEAAERYRRKHPEEAAAEEGAGTEEAAVEETDEDLPKRLREAKPEGLAADRPRRDEVGRLCAGWQGGPCRRCGHRRQNKPNQPLAHATLPRSTCET